MGDDRRPARGRGGGIRGARAILLLALAVLLPVVAGIAVWRAADEHKILPGLDGCATVRERGAQLDCYSDEFQQMADEEGLTEALRRVDEEAQDSITLGSDCHVAWHPVGERDGAKDAREGNQYDNIAAETTCQQGYSHGYTIGFMGEREPTTQELGRIVTDDCGASTGLTSLYNCTHSYGHVIARRYRNDVASGIEACSRVDYTSLPGADARSPVPGEPPPVPQGAEHQCLYGFYMEVALLDVADGDTRLDACDTATTQPARKACYAYLPARVNAIVGDLAAAGRACHELAPAGELRDSCVKTFSVGLPSAERCSYLVSKAERVTCRHVINLRDNQEDLLEFTSGDPDSFDANVRIAPEPGVKPPDTAPAAPNEAPPG